MFDFTPDCGLRITYFVQETQVDAKCCITVSACDPSFRDNPISQPSPMGSMKYLSVHLHRDTPGRYDVPT